MRMRQKLSLFSTSACYKIRVSKEQQMPYLLIDRTQGQMERVEIFPASFFNSVVEKLDANTTNTQFTEPLFRGIVNCLGFTTGFNKPYYSPRQLANSY